jgi:hypothetical protein
MPKSTLLALTLATVLTPAFAADPVQVQICARLTPSASTTEDIDMSVRIDPASGTLSPIGAVAWNRSRGNKPAAVWGNCDATTCRIGAKETPIAGQNFIREWGGQFDLATLQGTANIYDIGVNPSTNQVGIGHKTATLEILLRPCLVSDSGS